MQIDTIFASSIFVKCALVQEKMGREENEITFSVMNAAKDVSMFACAGLEKYSRDTSSNPYERDSALKCWCRKGGSAQLNHDHPFLSL